MIVTVKGLAALEAKLRAIPPTVQAAAERANLDNATDFAGEVERIIPRDHGKLAATLEIGPGKQPLSTQVSIGGPDAPYPAHLEYGHMTKGGKHVPAEPFWWPSWRINRKRFRDRASRAAAKAIRVFRANGQS